ncbi:MAG TPA: ABC transporter substrate-binding protein [Acidimicrobiia bacterium]|nr:ABC transporter substrate-binding protein [Acidimicrobiia bacterium]
MTRRRPRSTLLALIATLALLAAACGDGAGDTTTTAGPGTTAAPGTTQPPDTTDTTGATDTTAAPDTTGASGEPIKIGMLADMSVTFTPWGVNVRDGMLLAADEINAAGGVDGRMIEIVMQDSENDAEVGVTGFERLVEEGVVAVGGILSSGVGAPVSPVAEELQIPTFLVKSGTEAALTADSRFVFRTCLPAAPMTAPPVLQYAQEEGITNVGVIIADYPWGQSFRAAVENTFEGSDVDYGEIQVAPVPPDTDFTPYVRAMADAGAEMVIATGHPPGNAAIVALAADLIGDVPVTGAWIPPDLAVGSLADIAIGRYADFACADYTSDSYAELAARYLEFSDNALMSDDAVAGHGIVTMVADAVANVGDDPVAIAEYLHDQTYELEGYAHPVSWTEWGELAASQPVLTLISEGPAPEGLNEAGEWWFEKLSQSDPLQPYQP